jgi:hypothetical protein
MALDFLQAAPNFLSVFRKKKHLALHSDHERLVLPSHSQTSKRTSNFSSCSCFFVMKVEGLILQSFRPQGPRVTGKPWRRSLPYLLDANVFRPNGDATAWLLWNHPTAAWLYIWEIMGQFEENCDVDDNMDQHIMDIYG